MKLGMMLPVGSGALGGNRPPRWRELRDLVKLAEAVNVVDPPGVRGIERFAPLIAALRR
jgi:hypothetical protein